MPYTATITRVAYTATITQDYSSVPTYVYNEPTLTALTGGAATALDSLLTANGLRSTGNIVVLSYDATSQQWQLVAGTDAEDSAAGIVRPDDYNASTNARVWKRIA